MLDTGGFDDMRTWRLELDVSVTTVAGRRRVRSFRYGLAPSWSDPTAAEVALAVIGRVPKPDAPTGAEEWEGRPCRVALDWSRDHQGRQVVWVSGVYAASD